MCEEILLDRYMVIVMDSIIIMNKYLKYCLISFKILPIAIRYSNALHLYSAIKCFFKDYCVSGYNYCTMYIALHLPSEEAVPVVVVAVVYPVCVSMYILYTYSYTYMKCF